MILKVGIHIYQNDSKTFLFWPLSRKYAYVSTHLHKVLSLSFSKNSVSNYAGFSTLILEYFNYSIGRRVPQKVYFCLVFLCLRLSILNSLVRSGQYVLYFNQIYSVFFSMEKEVENCNLYTCFHTNYSD